MIRFINVYFRNQYKVIPIITAAEQIEETESDAEVDKRKKRYKKEKIGFRDRKVILKPYIKMRK